MTKIVGPRAPIATHPISYFCELSTLADRGEGKLPQFAQCLKNTHESFIPGVPDVVGISSLEEIGKWFYPGCTLRLAFRHWHILYWQIIPSKEERNKELKKEKIGNE